MHPGTAIVDGRSTALRLRRAVGSGGEPARNQRVVPWVPLVPLKMGPLLAAGDTRLYDYGLREHLEGLFPYLVMEWFEGLSLYVWARRLVLSSRRMMRVLAPMAGALAATHAADAVHRDVKGDNILVRPGDSYPMLLDFGAGDFRGALTLTCEVLQPGTTGYRSPEVLRFQESFWQRPGARYEAGPTDDLCALGITAYCLVTGSYPSPWVAAEIREQELSFPTVTSEPPEKWPPSALNWTGSSASYSRKIPLLAEARLGGEDTEGSRGGNWTRSG